MTVLDFGAGTCWLSRYLAQMGCATVSVDPSKTALELGRQWFEVYPPSQMPKPPTFLVFDGHRIDLPDASVDRIVSFDAFHHVPNPREVLAEFARIVRPGGLVGFSEPGAFHSRTDKSQEEMQEYRVLENDILIEDLELWALASGFTEVWAEVSLIDDRPRMSPSQVALAGKSWWRFPRKLSKHLVRLTMNTLRNKHFFYMAKGPLQKDSRWAEHLACRISIVEAPSSACSGETFEITVGIVNAGDVPWLHGERADIGNVNLALQREDVDTGELAPMERFLLPRSLGPGDATEMKVPLSWPSVGRLHLHLDLVAEQVSWFEQQGGTPARVEVQIQPR